MITGLLSLMIVSGALGLERPEAHVIGWLKRVGDSAYSIYLWHIPTQGAIWILLSLFRITNALFGITLATVASTAVGLVAYQWLERPLTHLFDRLDGRWKVTSAQVS